MSTVTVPKSRGVDRSAKQSDVSSKIKATEAKSVETKAVQKAAPKAAPDAVPGQAEMNEFATLTREYLDYVSESRNAGVEWNEIQSRKVVYQTTSEALVRKMFAVGVQPNEFLETGIRNQYDKALTRLKLQHKTYSEPSKEKPLTESQINNVLYPLLDQAKFAPDEQLDKLRQVCEERFGVALELNEITMNQLDWMKDHPLELMKVGKPITDAQSRKILLPILRQMNMNYLDAEFALRGEFGPGFEQKPLTMLELDRLMEQRDGMAAQEVEGGAAVPAAEAVPADDVNVEDADIPI